MISVTISMNITKNEKHGLPPWLYNHVFYNNQASLQTKDKIIVDMISSLLIYFLKINQVKM